MVEIHSPEGQTPQRESLAEKRIRPVLDVFAKLPYDTVRSLLDTKMQEAQAIDATAGIAIVPLVDRDPVKVGDRLYKFYIARVLPGTFVNPHVHPPKGQEAGQTPVQGPDDEPYFFYSSGEMNTAAWENGEVKDWKSEQVGSGVTYIVAPNRVHSLRNPNPNEPLDFAFACPDDHLDNYSPDHPEGNRIMTVDLPNGMPPQYSRNK